MKLAILLPSFLLPLLLLLSNWLELTSGRNHDNKNDQNRQRGSVNTGTPVATPPPTPTPPTSIVPTKLFTNPPRPKDPPQVLCEAQVSIDSVRSTTGAVSITDFPCQNTTNVTFAVTFFTSDIKYFYLDAFESSTGVLTRDVLQPSYAYLAATFRTDYKLAIVCGKNKVKLTALNETFDILCQKAFTFKFV